MKVDVAGLVAAAQKLQALAVSAQGLLAETAPLAPDTTSGGAAARLNMASLQLWGAACAQAAALFAAGEHLQLIAAKFCSEDMANASLLRNLVGATQAMDLMGRALAMDDAGLATLDAVPLVPPDVRVPLPAVPANVDGEAFSRQINLGNATFGQGFSQGAANNASAIDTAATTVREVAASVPELWDSPVGTAALSGRLLEHAAALAAISDRWFELASESRRHADDFTETVAATPTPQEFEDNQRALDAAIAARSPTASQLAMQHGMLNAKALAEATRYAGVTETTTAPKGTGTTDAPGAGVPGGAGPSGVPGGVPAGAAAPQGASQLTKTGATAGEAAQAGQAGDAAGQLAQLLPSALGAIGGMAGGAAGMVGQVPQQLMQTGQGLMQAATQGLSGMGSQKPTDAELAKSVSPAPADDGLGKDAQGGGPGGGVGDTHPAGAPLGPPVTPSTAHTAPTMPAGAAAPPAPTPAGGTAMGGMPMGMPMGGMMPHGAQGGDGQDRPPADRKVVMPPQPHTEAVTGRVPDRTAAAAEAARSRAEADEPDDDPPRGPVVRRITLAPLHDEGP
jgi:hypothetical protein